MLEEVCAPAFIRIIFFQVIRPSVDENLLLALKRLLSAFRGIYRLEMQAYFAFLWVCTINFYTHEYP
jgi:hypothetical protein